MATTLPPYLPDGPPRTPRRPHHPGRARHDSSARHRRHIARASLLAALLAAWAATPAYSADAASAAGDAGEPVPAWQSDFDAQYRLADGENAKLIRPPFSAARDAFHRHHHPGVGDIAGQYTLRWTGGRAERRSWFSHGGTVASAFSIAEIDPVDLDGHNDLVELPVAGDWVVRDGATREAILADVYRELTKATDGRVRVEPAKLEKDVIVARGRYAFKPHPEVRRDPDEVHLFADTVDGNGHSGGGRGPLPKFLRHVGRMLNQKVVDETEPHEGDVSWSNNRSADAGAKSEAARELVLDNLAVQTSLAFRVERREVDVWRLTDEKDIAGGL